MVFQFRPQPLRTAEERKNTNSSLENHHSEQRFCLVAAIERPASRATPASRNRSPRAGWRVGSSSFGLFVNRVTFAGRAKLLFFDLPRLLWPPRGPIVSALAFGADQGNLDSIAHGLFSRLLGVFTRVAKTARCRYSRILVTMPAPTVRPPSRIAKRICSSRPTGVMSEIVMVMLSPGMTIFVPSGSSQVPVTSVVRM